ncbi:hypothetical protein Ddye_020443 [Dipteronia dyeriana]|uniref:Uncharacterized protein n=1 Tax=Dipteronia dyeriana TaxID=168575 RepID=A0AAD9U0K0_9ROSI|nr:hypothetical protein Ddye_020443 [Dipteronia dyeriana]
MKFSLSSYFRDLLVLSVENFNMSSSDEEGIWDVSITIQLMQQQFEHINVIFKEIQDRMERQDAVIGDLQEGRPQRVPNAIRRDMCTHRRS